MDENKIEITVELETKKAEQQADKLNDKLTNGAKNSTKEFDKMKNSINKNLGDIQKQVQKTFDGSKMVNKMSQGISKALDGIKSKINGILGNINLKDNPKTSSNNKGFNSGNGLTGSLATSGTMGAMLSKAQALKQSMAQTLSGVHQTVTAMSNKISSKLGNTMFGKAINSAKKFGSQMINTFKQGLGGSVKYIDKMKNKIHEWANKHKQATEKVKKANKSTGSTFKSLLQKVLPFASLYGVFNLLKSSISSFVESGETTSKFATVMGSNVEEATKWVDELTSSVAVSKSELMDASSSMMAIGKSMGMTGDEAYKMATSMSELAIDMDSFYNRTDSLDKVRSAMTGEYEPLKALGIVLTEDSVKAKALAMGLDATSNSSKMLARQALITEQMMASGAFGDAERTAGSLSNQLKMLKFRYQELKTAIGSCFSGLLQVVLPVLNTIVVAVTNAFNRLAQIINSIFGIFGIKVGGATSGGGAVGDAVGDITDSLGSGLDGAGGDLADNLSDGANSAKEIAKGLMGIDELNVLSSDKGSGGSGSGSGSGGTGGTGTGGNDGGNDGNNGGDDFGATIAEWVERMARIFTNSFNRAFNYDMFNDFINNCKRVGQSIADIFSNEELQLAMSTLANTLVSELGSLVGSVGTLAVSIGNAIIGGIADSLEKNKQYIIEKLIGIANIEREASVIRQRLYEALSNIFSTLGGEEAKGIVNNIFTTLTVGFLEGQELISKLGRDVVGFFAKGIIDNQDKIKEAWTGILGVIESLTGSIGEAIQNAFKHVNKVYDEKVKPFIDSMSQGLSDLWGILLDGWNEYVQPVMDNIAQKFDEVMNGNVGSAIQHTIDLVGNIIDYLRVLWEETLKPIAEFVASVLAPVFSGAFDIICTTVLNFIDVVAGIFDGIVQVFNGVIEFITGIFSGDLEKALGGLGKIWEGLVKIVSSIWDSIWDNTKEIWGKIWEHICEIWEEIKQSVVDYILKIKDKMEEKFGKLVDTAEEKWEEIKDAIWDKCVEIWDNITGWFTDIVDWFKGGWKDSKDETTKGWNNIDSEVNKGGSKTNKSTEGVMSTIGSTISKAWDSIKTGASTGWSNIKTTVTDWATKTKDGATGALGKVTSGASSIWSSVSSGVTTGWSNIKSNVSSWASKAKDGATSTLSGVTGGVSNIWNNVKNGVSGAWNNVKSAVSGAVGKVKDQVGSSLSGAKDKVSTVWSNIKNGVSGAWNNVKSAVGSSAGKTKDQVYSSLKGAKDSVTNVWTNIKNGVKGAWDSIRNAVQNAVNKVKGCMNFSWSLPKPSIPKFSVSGGKAPWGFGGKGKLPSISIRWNAQGGIFDSPTIFNTSRGFQGVGEAGAEAILPLDRLWDEMDKRFAQQNKVLSNNNNNGGDIHITLTMDGKEIAKGVYKNQREMTKLGQMDWDFL